MTRLFKGGIGQYSCSICNTKFPKRYKGEVIAGVFKVYEDYPYPPEILHFRWCATCIPKVLAAIESVTSSD